MMNRNRIRICGRKMTDAADARDHAVREEARERAGRQAPQRPHAPRPLAPASIRSMNGVAHANTAWNTIAIDSTNSTVDGHGRLIHSSNAAPRRATRDPGDSTPRQRRALPSGSAAAPRPRAAARPPNNAARALAELAARDRPAYGESSGLVDQEPLDLRRGAGDARAPQVAPRNRFRRCPQRWPVLDFSRGGSASRTRRERVLQRHRSRVPWSRRRGTPARPEALLAARR